MQNRAYSKLEIKAVDESRRVITGVATTPSVDRVGDIIDPLGVEFDNPLPFLWMHDISLKDPYYILPVLMGLSMFVLSWIGMRSAPPNPQTKMMSYMMPAMFTIMFMNLSSGLNLYYAVQNIAALPQQWMIGKERAKAGPPPTPKKT